MKLFVPNTERTSYVIPIIKTVTALTAMIASYILAMVFEKEITVHPLLHGVCAFVLICFSILCASSTVRGICEIYFTRENIKALREGGEAAKCEEAEEKTN